MPADQDVYNGINGVQSDGTPRPWAWVRGRARTVLGDLMGANRKPFSRVLPNGSPVAATTSQLDHDVLTAEQVGWRYIDSTGTVWDLKDFVIVLIEKMVAETDADKLAKYRQAASTLRPWPQDFPAKPDFE
ncbi:hypothetical protein ORI20_12935 [Mycobacterium sp. CVI_P3]|uniref:Tail assembly chaperone n=1 Tax=Mycobacterium pinniadriaticum TaxID=2994102 RepID=A0ABT3SEM5_9MYCO|nr:hypothetical protein [Mycobacterium pinniadriaticum]MCX2931188.1 hypothetical protein [Mycobacterium pinniadriaticum]MCX2937588.1 hypothetical protein [Mycobacterium pinniadriaticum]